MNLRETDPIPTRHHEKKPQRALRVVLRRIRGKPTAEVGKSSGPVSRAAQAEAASETSHKRGARVQKHNGARNTRTEGASGAGANHRTCQEEQLRDRPASVYLSRGPSSDFNGAACVETLVDCRFRGHVTCARCVC